MTQNGREVPWQVQVVIAVAILLGVPAVLGIGGRLSPDALGMAVGLVFGVLAGVPTALLVLAANRRHVDDVDEAQPQAPPQLLAERITVTERVYGRPGVVVRSELPAAYVQPLLPGPGAPAADRERRFQVVGEREEWLDEW